MVPGMLRCLVSSSLILMKKQITMFWLLRMSFSICGDQPT
jgi:hypothetical protein